VSRSTSEVPAGEWKLRWPLLAVNPALKEEGSAEAAKTLAEAALAQTRRPPAEDVLELLQMCGLTARST